MSLSEYQIGKLIEWFVNSSKTRQKWSEHRKKALEENHRWIQPNVIQSMSDEELESRFVEYYKSGGGRQTLHQMYRDRIIRDKKRFRKTLLHLLDESVDIKERIDQVLEGKYHIEGSGQALLTSFLMDWNPDKYCLWNNKTDMGFSVLGWKVYNSGDSYGTAYVKVLDSLQKLRDLRPEFKLSFSDIDLFLHTISAEDDGKEAVKEITKGDSVNYWIFQGNPKIYDVIRALKDNILKTWSVTRHKDKIKIGDKVILWVAGKRSGCYALCTVTSEIINRADDPIEQRYYTDKSQNKPHDKVEIEIDYNLWDKPILTETIENNPIFKDIKRGIQGTNFTATKEQYEVFLEMVKEGTTISKARKYWLYAPGENASEWEELYKAGIMAIGWDGLGDLRNYKNRDEITRLFQKRCILKIDFKMGSVE